MTNEQAQKLEYPFTPDEIEWRVLRTNKDKTKGQVAAYVDSRAIQNRLDAVLGRENWQNNFVTVQGPNNDTTSHICQLSIYYEDRKEWISKSDGASSTDIEPIKGGLSNAFKRAASMWGLGRYLYGLKNIWAFLDEYKAIDKNEFPKLDDIYVKYVKQYLAEQSKKTGQKEQQQPTTTPQVKKDTPPAPAKNEPKQAPQPTAKPTPAQNNVPSGRYSGAQAANQPPQADDTYQITDLRVTKGGNGPTTLITFQSHQGEKVTGYIKGEAPLKTGQIIRSPKILKKNSPIVGNYNIIESYEIAA